MLAALASFGAWFVVAPVPLDLSEEAALASPETLPWAARPLARLAGGTPRAWRALGAAGLGCLAFLGALLARRVSHNSAAPPVVGLLIAGHAAVLLSAADVAGSVRLLALAAMIGAAVAWGSGPWRKGAAFVLAAAGCVLFPQIPSVPPAGDLVRLVLNRAPDAGLPALVAASVAAGVVAAGLAGLLAGRAGLIATALAAAAFAAMGAGTALRELGREIPRRAEIQRFLAAFDAIPADGSTDVVLDAPSGGVAWSAARPRRPCVSTIEAAALSDRVRLFHWTRPAEEGPMSTRPRELFPVLAASTDTGISLLDPAADARLHARCAEDEPEFRFSPGPGATKKLHVVVVAETPGGTRVFLRDLDDAILRRSGTPEAPVLAWRPAWRPMDCAERELRWEDGELCPPGSSFWWTIAVAGEHDECRDAPRSSKCCCRGGGSAETTRIAPFRRASVLP